jgi:hypothetical protein
MSGSAMGFLVWAILGAVMIAFGTRALFICYGIIFIVLGLPLLTGQNSALILLSVLGVMLETIAMMAIYIMVITKKYRG